MFNIPEHAVPSHREYLEACNRGNSDDWLQWRTMSVIFRLLHTHIFSAPYFGLEDVGVPWEIENGLKSFERRLQLLDDERETTDLA